MASSPKSLESSALPDIDSGSDDKGHIRQIDSVGKGATGLPITPLGASRFETPEWIRNLSPQERLEIESKLKRKIDLRLMPMIILMYIMNYLDRVSQGSEMRLALTHTSQNNIAAAKLAGILTDLNLKGVEFQVSNRSSD